MSNTLKADELEREILLMHQELTVKRTLLEECRQKLQEEIMNHNETKSNFIKYSNENKELKFQLEVSLEATRALEEEIKKNRELHLKLQVQADAYSTERQDCIDRCYQLGVENNALKIEITDLKEALKGHLAFQENYKTRHLETTKIVEEIVRKQEILNKEQNRLEMVCKEGLKFCAKISEEAAFQAKFVKKANESQKKMEEEMIHLLAIVREYKDKEEKFKDVTINEEKSENYLEEWKSYELSSKVRTQELLKENQRLMEELNFATAQIEQLIKKF